MSRIEIQKQLNEQMHSERFSHTLGVMYTAASLAMRYGADMEKALMAGLLHDCAKIRGNTALKMIETCEANQIAISASERENPVLLHAKVGAHLAQVKYQVSDHEILSAIAAHTTGKPEMTTLDKIIYIADFIEPNRTKASNLEIVRNLAFQDLDQCLYRILEDSLIYLKKTQAVIDPMTEITYKYYKRNLR